MPTIKDIADRAGVSVATVSRVINNGPKVGNVTRNRVKQVMADLDYRPNATARALVSQKSTTLGLVIPEMLDPFFATLAHGIDRIARERKRQLLMSTGSIEEDIETQAIDTLLQHRCDAMVVHSKALSDEALCRYARQIPGFVLINRFVPEIKERCVWLDNTIGGELMARHLLDLGHKRIAVISSQFNIEDPTQRLNGIHDAMKAAGLSLNEQNIARSTPDQAGGEIAVRNLLSQGAEFSGLLAYNDAMAAGAMKMLSNNGIRVPEDVSIVGYDDVLLAKYCSPQLTTMQYPIELMAVRAAELAIACADGYEPDPKSTHKYTPTLVKRESTAVCS